MKKVWIGGLFKAYFGNETFLKYFPPEEHIHIDFLKKNPRIPRINLYWSLVKQFFSKERFSISDSWSLASRKRENLSKWKARKEVLRYQYALKNFFEIYKCDTIIFWSGFSLKNQVLASIAKEKGFLVIYMENGAMPRTTQVDSCGVNYQSSFSYNWIDSAIKMEISPKKLQELWGMKLIGREKNQDIKIFIENEDDDSDILLPKEYLFLPFQVHDDTQLILFSPWIKTMSELVDIVWESTLEYNKVYNKQLKIVCKEHPSDYGRIDYSELKKKWKPKGVIFANQISTEMLIENASVIITINSSVGVEALLKKKPVITLGDAFYNFRGVTQKIRNKEKLVLALAKIKQECDWELIGKMLYYMRYEWLVTGSWRDIDEEHIKSLDQKLKILIGETDK